MDKLMQGSKGPVVNLEDIGTYTRPNGEEWSSVRDLYEYLGLAPAAFTRWCKSNIDKNAFAVEEVDYERINMYVETFNGGQKPALEYSVHPDFGAKLCMISRSPKAEEVRNWFLARNKRLAALEAAAPALPAVPQTQSELILMLAQNNVDQERRVSAVEVQVKELTARIETSDTNYYTVAGYASKIGKLIPREQAVGYGRRAGKISRDNGAPVGSVHDPRFGSVNTYHKDILKGLFGA